MAEAEIQTLVDIAPKKEKKPETYVGDRKTIYNIARNAHIMMKDRGYELSLKLSSFPGKNGKIDVSKTSYDEFSAFESDDIIEELSNVWIKKANGVIIGLVAVQYQIANKAGKMSGIGTAYAFHRLETITTPGNYEGEEIETLINNVRNSSVDQYVVIVSESTIPTQTYDIMGYKKGPRWHTSIQIFSWLEMAINVFNDDHRHYMIPKHTRVRTRAEIDAYPREEGELSREDIIKQVHHFERLPRLHIDDPVCRYFDFVQRDIIRIEGYNFLTMPVRKTVHYAGVHHLAPVENIKYKTD